MSDSASSPLNQADQPIPEQQPTDGLFLGFFVLLLILSSLVALMILIAYRNGT